jgi:mono/diheme cytochrome c family protein
MSSLSLTRSIGLALASCGFLCVTSLLPASYLQAAKAPARGSKKASKPMPDGQKLFTAKCAPCHGQNGLGGSGYRGVLSGSLTESELAGFIKRSMPPGAKKCPAPAADKIAAYMFDAFYSPIAQARIRPPRIELARLTVPQFRNAVADLVSGFHPATPSGPTHGLYAEYFKGRSRDQANRVISRVDPDVRFDFGTGAPDDKGFDPKNFSISWQGSVLAPDTGEYEFSIHSKYSCQLWINDTRYPVVDGEVRSANDADPSGSITLLGGRAYALRMVFTKATQGVDDPKKKDAQPPTTSYVTLRWHRPDHADEPIPTQFLFPESTPKTFVVTSPFPPDDRSMGYLRGDSVSKEWDDAATSAALETAEYIAKNLPEVTGVPDAAPDREARLKEFCLQFLERAFRRPLTEDLKRLYLVKQFNVAPNLETAVKRVVVLTLKSPRFLYREIGAREHDAYLVASQLSFGLWDSIPDPELEKAAATGQLSSLDQINAQAQRMTEDNRAWSKLRQFLLLWLKIDEVPDIVKNAVRYPTFNPEVASDLRTSLELFLQSTAWSKSSDYRDLMLSDKEFFNGRLAALYGVNLPANAPFQEVTLDPGQRAGVITQPYILSRFAYLDGSDPIHRGVLIYRNLLGRILNPPPSAFAPLAASAHPDLTTRQRVAFQTKPQFCANCHGRINPVGFTLEEFDAIGKLRSADNGKPIDCSGMYRSSGGSLVRFSGAKELAEYLADSDDARDAFVEKLFLNVAKQPPLAFGTKTLDQLEASFVKNQYSIRSLLRDMAVATAVGKG